MSTGVNGWRFPDYTDTPDVPRDLGILGTDIAAYIAEHPGPQGPSGNIAIGTVSTVSASTPASVVNVGTSSSAILNLTLPRGIDGILGGPGPSNVLSVGTATSGAAGTQPVVTITGTSPSQTINFVIPQGSIGQTGSDGPEGPKGDAAATIAVQSTTTGSAGTNAIVTNSGTSSNVLLNFTIPRGANGANGIEGIQGPPGADGAAGTNASIDPVSTTIGLNIPTTSSFGVNSNWYPVFNNFYTIGQAIDTPNGVNSNRFWKTIYSNTGIINTSDLRLKTNIENSSLGLDFINNLRPVSYKFIEGSRAEDGSSLPGERTHWGLIAQEVQSVIEDAGVDFGGWVLLDKTDSDSEQALRYEEFIAPLIKAVQELTARVKSLEG